MENFADFPDVLISPQQIRGTPIKIDGIQVPLIQRGDNDLTLEILAVNPNLQVPDDLLGALKRIASWQVLPPILEGKRTAWVQPRTPIEGIRGISIKGIGLNKKGKVHPPKGTPYHEGVLDKVVFDQSGRPSLQNELTEPLGGFSLAAARQEWVATLDANKHDVHATTPIALAQYPNILWEGAPMGVLMLGSPSAFDIRLETALLLGDNHPYMKDRLKKNESLTEFMERIYASIGTDLAKLHFNQKAHRIQPHFGNFSFDFEVNRTIFNDLEQIEPLPEDLSIQALYMINDLAAVLRHLIEALSQLVRINYCSMDEANEVIVSFLCGYFGKSKYNDAHSYASSLMDPNGHKKDPMGLNANRRLFTLFFQSCHGKTHPAPYDVNKYEEMLKVGIAARATRNKLLGLR